MPVIAQTLSHSFPIKCSACALSLRTNSASNHGVEHGNLRHTRSAAMRRVARQRAHTLKLSSRQVHGRSRSISLSPQHAHSACAPTASNHGVEHGNPLTGVDRSFSVAFEQRRNRGRRGGNAMLLANGCISMRAACQNTIGPAWPGSASRHRRRASMARCQESTCWRLTHRARVLK